MGRLGRCGLASFAAAILSEGLKLFINPFIASRKKRTILRPLRVVFLA